MKRQITAWLRGSRFWVLLLIIFVAGCGNGGNGGNGGTAALSSIAVTPTGPSIALGTTQQFTATGTYSDSSTRDITTSVTWSSSDTSAATISNVTGSKGLATSVASGSTTITAILGTIPGNTTLTVTAPPQATLTLPETGQTISYGANDDGSLRKGVAWPSPRFVVSGDCVTDSLTGLMWVKSPDSTQRAWADALTYANDLSLCDYSDWRLPNRKELRGLINYGQSSSVTWLEGQGFSNVQAAQYWSSTTYAPDPLAAWAINMGDGSMGVPARTASHYVWPVRSSQ